MVKLIYGKNGIGKSEYSKLLLNDGYRLIDRNIINFYEPTSKIFSEYRIEKNKIENAIKEQEKKLLSKRSSIFKDGMNSNLEIGEFKDILKTLKFSSYKDWLNYDYKNHEHIGMNVIPGKIGMFVDRKTHKIFTDFKKSSVNYNEFSAFAILYSELKEIEFDKTYKSTLTDFVIESIEKIINDFMTTARNLIPVEITNLSYEQIKSCLLADNDSLANINEKAIKQMIIYSDEFVTIRDLTDKLNNLGKTSLNFSQISTHLEKYNATIIDDGFSIQFENNLSSGELASAIIDIMTGFSEVGKIIIDDLFETLDISNLRVALSRISDLWRNTANLEMVIATHDINTAELSELVFSENKVDYETYTIVKVKENAKDVFKAKKVELFGTYSKFILNLTSSSVQWEKDSISRDVASFIRLISRYKMRDGALSDMSHNKMKDIWGVQFFKFSSNSFQHYTQNIDKVRFKKLFIFSNFVFPQNDMDTIYVCNELIRIFKNHSKKTSRKNYLGINIDSIVNYLEDLYKIFEIERDLILKDIRENTYICGEMNDDRLIRLWIGEINGISRSKRNEIVHLLDSELTEILEK